MEILQLKLQLKRLQISSKIIYTLILYVFFSNYSFSQKLSGSVINVLEGTPISLANLQLLNFQSKQTLAFTNSNQSGQFSFSINSNEINTPIIVKVTHISYEPFDTIIEPTNDLSLVFKLIPKSIRLEEIVIPKNSFDIEQRNDTIKYNLSKILNGSELKLKDIINKLPGLSIDENKKIKYLGKQINHILVNGDEFFGDNHQIATENITSEMIDDIELLTNYQDLSTLKDFKNKDVTALNLKLNKKFSNILKANIELEGGVLNSFASNNYIYNYGKANKFNLTYNSNNINSTIISINDYAGINKYTGKKIIEETQSGNKVTIEEDLPNFLFATDNIKSKKLDTYTLNYTYSKNDKVRIEFISIFNNIKQSEFRNTLQKYYLDDLNIENKNSLEGRSLFLSNIIKVEKKVNESTYLKLHTYFSLLGNKQEEDIQSLSNLDKGVNVFNNDIKDQDKKFGFNFLYRKAFSENHLFESIIYTDYALHKKDFVFHSNSDFQYLQTPTKQINQNSEFSVASYGIKMKSSLKKKYGVWNFYLLSTIDTQKFDNINLFLDKGTFKDDYLMNSNTAGVTFGSKLFNSKLNYSLGGELVNNNYDFYSKYKNSTYCILPKATVNYEFNKKLKISLNYNKTNKVPSIHNFLSGNVLQDYRTIQLANNLENKRVLTNNYQASVYYVNVFKNLFTLLTFSKSSSDLSFGKRFNYNSNIVSYTYDYLNNEKSTSVFFIIEKKYSEIPYGFNLDILSGINSNNTIVNQQISNNENRMFRTNVNIKSFYKSPIINFSTGVIYQSISSKSRIEEKLQTNEMNIVSPYINLTGSLYKKKINWELRNKIDFYSSSLLNSDQITNIGVKFSYMPLNNLTLYISGDNILNINKNNKKHTISNTEILVEEGVIGTLSGYFNIGAKLSL